MVDLYTLEDLGKILVIKVSLYKSDVYIQCFLASLMLDSESPATFMPVLPLNDPKKRV